MQYMQSLCSCTLTKYFSRYWHIYILIPCPKHALTLNIEALHKRFFTLNSFHFQLSSTSSFIAQFPNTDLHCDQGTMLTKVNFSETSAASVIKKALDCLKEWAFIHVLWVQKNFLMVLRNGNVWFYVTQHKNSWSKGC